MLKFKDSIIALLFCLTSGSDVVLNDRVWLISIGSSSRPKHHAVQTATIAKHFKLIKYTEDLLPPCHVCEVGTGLHYPKTMALEHDRIANKLDKTYSPGWWCAQKRVLLALNHFFGSVKSSADLPDFVMVMDDDTFVNPHILTKFLSKHDPDTMLFTGDIMHARDAHGHGDNPEWFIGGGGGTILSRALLQQLKQTVGRCLEKAQAGEWCDWHSDWTLATCVNETVAGLKPLQSKPFFNQLGGYTGCHKFAATCHTNLSASDLSLLYENVTSTGPGEQEQIHDLIEVYIDEVNSAAERAQRWIITSAVAIGRGKPSDQTLWPLITRAINIRRTMFDPPLPVDLLKSARTHCPRWGLSACVNVAHRKLVQESSDGVGWGGW